LDCLDSRSVHGLELKHKMRHFCLRTSNLFSPKGENLFSPKGLKTISQNILYSTSSKLFILCSTPPPFHFPDSQRHFPSPPQPLPLCAPQRISSLDSLVHLKGSQLALKTTMELSYSAFGLAALAVASGYFLQDRPKAKAVPASLKTEPASALKVVAVSITALCCTAILLIGFKLASLGFKLYHWTPPTPREFSPPGVSKWKPTGNRHVAANTEHFNYSVVAFPDSFHTMHANVHNDDSVWTVAAPMFELDWVAEPDMFVCEGPTLDNRLS
jgi:hypothetical protein